MIKFGYFRAYPQAAVYEGKPVYVTIAFEPVESKPHTYRYGFAFCPPEFESAWGKLVGDKFSKLKARAIAKGQLVKHQREVTIAKIDDEDIVLVLHAILDNAIKTKEVPGSVLDADRHNKLYFGLNTQNDRLIDE